MQVYSNPDRENEEHALPDIEVFEMSAEEVATSGDYEDELFELSRRHEFRLAAMNGRTRDALIAALIKQEGLQGGWFWQAVFPGCLPDGPACGPYKSYGEAIAAAQDGGE